MKIAIFGAGRCGEYVVQEIQKCKVSKVEVKLIIDNDPAYFEKFKCNVPVVSLKCFMDLYCRTVDCVLIAVQDEMVAQEMAVSLLNADYHQIYFVPEVMLGGKLPVLNQSGELASYMENINFRKPVLPYVEYHVSDYCNLKCKRCGHFSNLITEKAFPDIDEFGDAIRGISKKFRNVKRFRLMGGEPLVNPDLDLFIYETRKVFPYADIRVVTNGLLVPQMSDRTVEAIKKCGAVIDISQYPPTRRMIEPIIKFVQEKDLKVQIGAEITKFFIQQGLDITEDIERIWSDCVGKTCYFLRGKRLYACCAVILLFENRDFLELNISDRDVENNSFDMVDGNESGWDILKNFLYPLDFCKYCTDYEWHEWGISEGEIKKEDWFVGLNHNCAKQLE